MNCPACGHGNPDGSRFCGQCAAPLLETASCPQCGAANPRGQRFCNSCAHPLDESAQVPVPGVRHPPVPDHLAEKILNERRSIEGERKQVTVLFADVKGSMDLAEAVDPETWRGVMDRFFAILCAAVHRFEGTVNKFTGDGIMALFGAPIAHEDHARRACYSALHIGDELTAYARELRREHGLNFSVRMGLNSGDVVMGTIGDDLDLEYTAIGHTVGLAQRMEHVAEPGKTYLTEHTARLVSGYFELRSLGPFEIKGVSRPPEVFELAGIGPIRTRLEASAARGLTRFIGREQEMAVLDAALAQALEGSGQIVGLVGEPGVGKSRLCYELAERCRAQGMLVTEGHGLAHGRTIPFLPILEMLRDWFGVSGHDSDEAAREKIAGRLLLLDEAFRDSLPLVFDFLGVADPQHPAPQMDPEARQRQLFAIGKQLVQARSRREPALILVEDLHWFDPGSEVFLAQLTDAIAGTRTLLLANFRPEFQAEWMHKSYYRRVSLVPLGAETIDELLGNLLGTDTSLADLGARIRERTAGNPFFIEEVIQSLADAGSLQGERGAYRLVHPVHQVQIPATVHDVLAARIDRLGEREKSVLQTAAVIGREFSEPVLDAVAAPLGSELASALCALVDSELLYERALYPEAQYAFKHPLTQEVSYGSQLAEHRAAVHAAVARAVEELYPEKLDECAALIAHHWEQAREPLEAARWSRRAAAWAGPKHPAEALRHWRRVRQLVAEVDESAETVQLGISACVEILAYGWRVGISNDELVETFTAGRALADRVGDARARVLITAAYGPAMALTGGLREALDNDIEVRRLVQQIEDRELRTVVEGNATWRWMAGDLGEALKIADDLIARTQDDPTLGRSIWGFSMHILDLALGANVLAMTGRIPDAIPRLARAVELAREYEDVEALGWSYSMHAWIAWLTGETEGVLERAGEGVEIAERLGSSWSRVLAASALAQAHITAGQWAEAAETSQEALDVARERGVGLVNEGPLLATLSDASLGRGDVGQACSFGKQAVAAARRRHTKAFEARAQISYGRALVRAPDDARTAEAALSRALELVHQTGAVSLEPFVRVELAELARIAGDEASWERERAEARRLFIQIGAPRRAAMVTGAGASVGHDLSAIGQAATPAPN
ncbi:MAG TPA: adenylate/guanylate cyclase domain-containing protein [Solirubrobacteraceae bacterium]|jgi:adenylate cyclase|nr:adenylate/guanylate cyclase domain-containing protein [Solirubrobacteraceae bacterium]